MEPSEVARTTPTPDTPARQTSSRDAGADASVCPSRTAMWLLALIIAGGTLLRIAAFVVLRSWQNPSAMEHRTLALSLLRTGQFLFCYGDGEDFVISSVQSPPYPLLLAGLYTIFGDSPMAYAAAMTLNALLGGVSIALTYCLARSMGGSARVGLLAAAAVALWPTQIYAVTVAQAIALIIVGTLAIMYLWQRSVRTGNVGTWLAFSVIGTLAALTEPVLLPVMALSGLLIFAHRNLTWAVRFRNAAILLTCALVIIGPWTVRNRLVHGKWVPIKNTFWVNVWKGNNPNATGTDRLPMPAHVRAELMRRMFHLDDSYARDPRNDPPRQYAALTPEQNAILYRTSEMQREEIFKQWATEWISHNKTRYAMLCLRRLAITFWIDWDNPKSWNIANVAGRAALLVFSAVGLALAIRRRWALGYPLLVAGSCVLTYMLTITAARFIMPLEPLMLCLSALTVSVALEKLGWKDKESAG